MPNLILSLAASAARLLPDPAKQAIYRVRPLARLIRGSLNRAAPRGLTQVQIAAGGLEGFSLLLDMQSEKDYWLGTYEPELQAAVADWVKPGMVIYDVGANIGYISLLLARATGETGRVFAFEALPANQARIRANLELNGMTARVEVVSCAVIDHSRPVRFLVGPSNGMGKAEGSAGRQEIRYGDVIEVPGIALDGFVYDTGNPAPQLVKMDIEGGEVLALPGMQRLLAEARPLILLELHGPEAAAIAWNSLAGAGYRICRMVSGYPAVPSFQSLEWKAYIVAIPAK